MHRFDIDVVVLLQPKLDYLMPRGARGAADESRLSVRNAEERRISLGTLGIYSTRARYSQESSAVPENDARELLIESA
jgi:hypothetical protein